MSVHEQLEQRAFPRSGRLRPLNAVAIGLLVAVALLLPLPAAACSVCFGDPDSQMAIGVNNGILVLLGVVGFVQIGFVALFWSFYNRARRLRRQREQFSIIDGGVH